MKTEINFGASFMFLHPTHWLLKHGLICPTGLESTIFLIPGAPLGQIYSIIQFTATRWDSYSFDQVSTRKCSRIKSGLPLIKNQ